MRDLTISDLVDGLRQLELLARLVPIEADGFAHAAGVGREAAAALIETYRETGFVRSVPHGSLIVLTPMALDRVFTHNLIGNLVTRGLERIGDLATALGAGAWATLSIRRGARMLRVLASEAREDWPVGTQTDMLESVEGQVYAAFSGDRKFGKADQIREAGFGFGREGGLAAAVALPLLVQSRPVGVLAGHFNEPPRPEIALPALQATAQALLRVPGELPPVLAGASTAYPAVLH